MHFNRRSGRNNATKQTSSTTDTSKNDDSNEPSRPRPATITITKSQAPVRKKLATPFRLCNGPQVQVLSTLEPPTSGSPTISNRNYESEKNLSTKPPLPVVHHRPPTRPSSRNEWAIASTSNNPANNNSNSRPTSPLTRSGHESKDNLFTPRAHSQQLRFANEAPSPGFQNQNKFQYSGPHQVYAGPHTPQSTNNNLADGPERLQWPPPPKEEADPGPESVSSISTASREFHRSICQSISGFPLSFRKTSQTEKQQQFPHQISKSHQVLTSSNNPRRFSRSHQVINDTTNNNPPPLRDDEPPIVPAPCLNSTESCPFRAFLEETRAQNQNPLKSVHSSTNVLLNDKSNASNFSSSNSPMNDSSTLFSAYAASFPRSLSRSCQHQQTESGNVNASMHSVPSSGPFVRSSVPDDIQDDLVRIELLMELRKYKRALSAQLEAQQRMIQMCNSGTITPPQVSSQQQHCSNNTQSCQLDQLPLLIGHYQQVRHAIEKIMDPFKIFSEEEKANQPQPPRSRDGLPQRPGTVWENDLEKHLNSDDFITSFNSQGARNQQNGVNGNLNANLASFVRDLQQNPTSVSLLRGAPTNTDEFQTARSLFPSGLMNDMGSSEMDAQEHKGQSDAASPIVVRSRGSVQKSNYQFGDAYPANFPEKSIASPVEPTKESLAQRRNQSQFMGPTHQLTPLQSSPNEKNNGFLGTLHSFPPAAFQLSQPRRADSAGKQPHTLETTGQMIMLRKPVQISKNRSGNNYLSASPPQSTITTISHIGMEDRPSPFFPGVAGDRIDMRLRSPVATERFVINRNDVEELGNLLSQLPVLSRKQKVEEFAFNTLKPPSPVTEAESETSMIPLASSLGTLTSRVTSSREDRPPTTIDNPSDNEGGGGGPPQSAVDGKNEHELMVDTDKMSIHELVTLGRKIYRILSQLSTACPNRNNASGCSIIPEQNQSSIMKGQARSVTAAVVDFNVIPNPTFITGPGPRSATHSKSSPKVIPSTFQPTTPFKKIVQPPPTRWGEVRSNSLNERHNSYRKIAHEPRSSSSIRPVSGVQTRTILKYDNNLNNNIGHSAKYTASYTVRNFNNSGDFQIPEKSSSKYNREDSDPYPVPPTFLDLDGSMSTGKSRSKRRNFIKENISKIRDMKRIPRQRLQKRLPPVMKRFDHVQSTIGSTARSDRSSSLNRDEAGDLRSQSRQRSSSLPPNHAAYGRSPSPAPARSNILRSSSSKSLAKSRSGDSLMKSGRQRKKKESSHVSKGTSKMKMVNNSKGSKVSSKTMLEESSSKVSVRKSRSKTKKTSGLAGNRRDRDLDLRNQSSDSTIAVEATTSKKPSKTKAASRSSAAVVIVNASKKRLRQSALKKSIKLLRSGPDYDDFDDDDGGGPPAEHLETTPSEQNMIKKIVKAEMDQLLDKSGYVMGVVKRTKEEKNVDYKSLIMPQHTDTESAVESENLTPVYTPPPYQDETLFSLENWINPEGRAPGTAYTSTKETPATTAEGADPEEKLFVRDKNLGKPQTVRFSLPQKQM